MSKAIWQLKATFATFQSCTKRAIVPPDPCSPMTNNALLPTLFSLELLHEKEEPLSVRQEFSSAIMCKPTKAHAFTDSTGMLGPNQLPEDHQLFLQEEEEELAIRPISFWDSPIAWRLCVGAHCPMHPERAKGPLPTQVASDLTPPDRWSLPPCFHTVSSQIQC